MQAIAALTDQGYILSVDHDDLVIKYTGAGHPDPVTIKPFLDELRNHKQQAIAYLTMAKLHRQVSDELAQSWQPGTRHYIEQHRPELAQEIDRAEAAGNSAWLAVEAGTGALDAFKVALAQWRQANLQAVKVFAERGAATRWKDDSKP
ncbi:MAG: hypothetical protein ABSC17_05145 [Thermacetogeniaceae bacterium]